MRLVWWRLCSSASACRSSGNDRRSLYYLGRYRPRTPASIIRFECPDTLAIALGQCKVVPSIEQAHAANRFDREGVGALAANDGLPFEIDGDGKIWRLRQQSHHLGSILFRDGCG